MILSYKKQEKALHPLARGTQKHAVLGNMKGTVTKPADDRRRQIELRIFLRSPDSPRADLNALPMQNSVIVRRQICRGKRPLSAGPEGAAASLLGDQHVAAVELGGGREGDSRWD